MFGIFNKKAVIVRNEGADVEVSIDIASVGKANSIVAQHLAINGSITIRKSVNDHDGHEITALEKVPKTRTWNEVDYIVLPSDLLDDESDSLGGGIAR